MLLHLMKFFLKKQEIEVGWKAQKTVRKTATRAGQDSKRVGVGISSALGKITGRFWEKWINVQKTSKLDKNSIFEAKFPASQ